MRPATSKSNRRRSAGSLSLDLGVALGLLTLVVVPFAYSYLQQQNQLRQAHHRAVAMELVDGEAEVLAAGALSNFPDGEAEYPVAGTAASRLPRGKFILLKNGSHGTLVWRPEPASLAGPVRREFQLVTSEGKK